MGISRISATAIVIANMVGTGIFTTSGFMAGDLGSSAAILIGWVLGGFLALCGAAVYAELGAMMPRVGGEYVYLREAYHPWLGFLAGWVSLLAGFSAPIAASALAFGAYLSAVAPAVPAKPAAQALIIAMTILHATDVQLGARVQTVFTALKVLLIVVFIGAGLTIGDGNWDNFTSGLGSVDSVFTSVFAVSLIFVAFSYSGWNAAAYIAGEIREPQKNLPKALLMGTGLVTVLYLLLNVVFLYAAPIGELAYKPEVGDVAARHLFGDVAGSLLSSLIAIALISSVSAMVMAGPRVYAAMAEDGMFFRPLARRNVRGAPILSVFLQGALASTMLYLGSLYELIGYVGFTLSVFAALTVLSVIVLRIKRPELPRPYRTFGYPVTPLLFVGLSGWMAYWAIDARPKESLSGLATLAAGFVVLGASKLVERLRSPRSDQNSP